MCREINRKHGAVAPVVGAARPVAVTGDVFPAGAGIPGPRRVDFGDDDVNRTIARLLIVELNDVQVLPPQANPGDDPAVARAGSS